jgi:hypothetical protein
LAQGILDTEMRKRGAQKCENATQENRGGRVRALQGCVLAETTVGPLLFDHLPRAFGISQEAQDRLKELNKTGPAYWDRSVLSV